ncbi:hypothetical protein OE749_06670 [Aestuariibacter sp. AA17]|uniref:ORC1/DEAH AAA+ ATPase domain-containing protein n=1 Tax=Fluctibacter corallii TaxID=2984329 RepID=A0ABT3A6V2_9ALTE|nr:AAA family ATPase [Aestuariibacter sp. AA17]MCV2884374.1 hypothetical protein [Aestuariibacter sp. AA17]
MSELQSRLEHLVTYSSQLIFVSGDSVGEQQQSLQAFISRQSDNAEIAFINAEARMSQADYRQQIATQLLGPNRARTSRPLFELLSSIEQQQGPVLIIVCQAEFLPRPVLQELWELVLQSRMANKQKHLNVLLFGDSQWTDEAKAWLPANNKNKPLLLSSESVVKQAPASELEAVIAEKRKAFEARIEARKAQANDAVTSGNPLKRIWVIVLFSFLFIGLFGGGLAMLYKDALIAFYHQTLQADDTVHDEEGTSTHLEADAAELVADSTGSAAASATASAAASATASAAASATASAAAGTAINSGALKPESTVPVVASFAALSTVQPDSTKEMTQSPTVDMPTLSQSQQGERLNDQALEKVSSKETPRLAAEYQENQGLVRSWEEAVAHIKLPDTPISVENITKAGSDSQGSNNITASSTPTASATATTSPSSTQDKIASPALPDVSNDTINQQVDDYPVEDVVSIEQLGDEVPSTLLSPQNRANALPQLKNSDLKLMPELKSSSFIVQISGISNEQLLHEYLIDNDLIDKVWIYPTQRNGNLWFLVLLNQEFSSIIEAREAIKSLPATMTQSPPFAKKVSQLQ